MLNKQGMKRGLQTTSRSRLQRWLRQRGHTQAKIATSLHVTRAAVTQWVGGKTRPAAEHRAALEELCGVPADGWVPADSRPPAPGLRGSPSCRDAAESLAASLTEMRELAKRLSDAQARVEQAFVATRKKADALDDLRRTYLNAVYGLARAVEGLGARLDQMWLALATGQRLDDLTRALAASAGLEGVPPPGPGDVRSFDASVEQLVPDARVLLGDHVGPKAARLMGLLMSLVKYVHPPRSEDFLAVLAVLGRCDDEATFSDLAKRFGVLVNDKPGIPRTGLSFYRAAAEHEI